MAFTANGGTGAPPVLAGTAVLVQGVDAVETWTPCATKPTYLGNILICS
ncbi:MAG: hypothetical protein ACYDBQ_08355 [Thermoplasmatota archaeon]